MDNQQEQVLDSSREQKQKGWLTPAFVAFRELLWLLSVV